MGLGGALKVEARKSKQKSFFVVKHAWRAGEVREMELGGFAPVDVF